MRRFLAAATLLLAATAAMGQAPTVPARLELPGAVALALRTHPAVGAARALHESARAAIGEAGAGRWPSLVADGTTTRFEEPMVVAPLHGFDPTRPPAFDRTLVQGRLSLRYLVFDGGARSARVSGARAAADAAAAGIAASEMDLAEAVTWTYLEVLARREVLDAANRRLASLLVERDRARQFFEEGRAARVELLRVDAAVARARADSVANAARLETAERDLARLTGLDRSHTSADGLASMRIRPEADQLAEAPAEAGAAHPDLERARADLARARADHRAARSQWLPDVDLVAGYTAFGSGAGDYAGEWQAGVRLSYPLFLGGGRSSANRRASAALRAAAERLRAAELLVAEAIDHARAALGEADARVAALTVAVEQSEEVARVERLALDAGAGVQSDYLTAEADLFTTRAALIEAQHAEIAALVALGRATGELSPQWLGRVLEVAP